MDNFFTTQITPQAAQATSNIGQISADGSGAHGQGLIGGEAAAFMDMLVAYAAELDGARSEDAILLNDINGEALAADELGTDALGVVSEIGVQPKPDDLDALIAQIEAVIPEGETLDSIDLTSLLAANPEIEAEVQAFIEATQLDSDAAIFHTLMLNKIALDDILKPVEAKDAKTLNDENLVLIKQKEIDEKLSELLALNLTPEQMSALKEELEARGQIFAGDFDVSFTDTAASEETLSDDSTGQAQALIAALFGTPVPVANNNAPVVNNSVNALAESAIGASQDAANALNNLSAAGGDTASPEGGDEQVQKYLDGNFKAALKNAEGSNAADTNNGAPKNAGANTQNAAAAATLSAGNSALQGWPFTMDGSLFAPQGQSFETHLEGLQSAASSNATQMGSLTSLISNAQSAGHSHPATQGMALKIQKAINSGGDTNLRIQLDPPELGRVEVKLQFGTDKTLKASMMVEKPETYMMLQRDAQILEKAIQDMGLDADGGIDFQLAEQGFDFDQNNQRGGGHDNGGTGAGSGESGEEDLIESTMTWRIDPESGHTRYDIWA